MNVKFSLGLPFIALLSLSAQVAQAVETTLTVSGQIMPVACTLEVSNGGSFAFGDIESATLLQNDMRKVGELENTYTIACHGPSRVALTIVDNREGTESNTAGVTAANFGIGTDDAGNKAGYNTYTFGTASVNSGAAVFIKSTDGGVSWSTESSKILESSPDSKFSFTRSGSSVPTEISSVTGTILAGLHMEARENLDLSGEFNVEGSATLQLEYL